MGESFTYDKLNRLETFCTNGVISKMEYDPHGRILSKQADGREVFTDAKYETIDANGLPKPHAISSATINKEILVESHRIEYTTFDKVRLIEGPVGMAEFAYGYDHQRVGMHTESGGMSSTKIYLSNCEIINDGWGNTTTLTYLSCPTGVFAVVEDGSEGSNIHYIYKDHLGSWTTITDHEGNIEQEQSYDAWGNTRDPYTWTGQLFMKPMFDRGFTGHEYLFGFDLINMNGRMYDPVLSSFLSVDSYVQEPDNSQSFNRYAYCFNNPLRYTDPSGEVAVVDDIIAAAIVGAIINGFVQTASGNVQNFGQWCLATAIGGVAGAAGAWAGGAAAGTLGGCSAGMVGGAAGGAVGGFINSAGNAWSNGASFSEGFGVGLIGGSIGSIGSSIAGGLIGGLSAINQGCTFWDGGRFIDYSEGAEALMEAFPNHNFDDPAFFQEYMANIKNWNNRLRNNIRMTFGNVDDELNLSYHSEITPTMRANGYKYQRNGTFRNRHGKTVLGTSYQHPNGDIDLSITPFVVTNKSACLFEAVVAHELTHAYHYFQIPSDLFDIASSEESALITTSSVYDYYGHHTLAKYHYPSGYDPFLIGPKPFNGYDVPSRFMFSPANFPYRVK